MISIFYCLCAIWALTSLSGCNQILKNIRSESNPINGDVTLLWDEVPGASSYNVYLSLSPGVTKQSGHKIPNATNPIRINYLAPGNTYYFVVTVVNQSGESQESKELSYFAVADKIGLVYWKQLFDQPIQDYKTAAAETGQEAETAPERTLTEPEKEPPVDEALIEKTAGDEKPSSGVTKETLPSPQKRVVNTADVEKDPTETSKPPTVAVAAGSDQKDIAAESRPTAVAVAAPTGQKDLPEESAPPTVADETGAGQAALASESAPPTVADETGMGQAALAAESEPATVADETGAGQAALAAESAPPTVADETGAGQEDLAAESEATNVADEIGTGQAALAAESEPATVAVVTGTDQNLSGWEALRLKAAQKLAASQFYIFFEQDSNELTPEAIEKLDQIYTILTNNAVAKLKLNGYSDSSGDPSFSQMVSEVRATSVKSYLTGRGIKSSRMTAMGFGDKKSLASNKSAEGRRLNRRVEIELIIP